MAKVLIISASLRKDSNTEMMAQEFEKGARESGNDVELVSLKGKRIGFCTGCLYCQSAKKCNIRDDANAIVEKMRQADVVVWAAPIYYYSVPGQMKTLIDRANALYVSEYNIRDVYFLMACSDESEKAAEGPLRALQGWIDCLPGTRLAGTVIATSTTDPGSVLESPAFMKAYNMGKSVGYDASKEGVAESR